MRKKREVEFDDIIRKIHKYYQILETEPGNAERNLVCSEGNSIPILCQDTMDHVEKILQDLEIEKQSNQETITDLMDRIRDISQTLDLRFESKPYENCSSHRVIEQLRAELEALEKERKKHMVVFIQKAGEELQNIWRKCYVSKTTKEKFMNDLESKIDDESQLGFYKDNIKLWNNFYNDEDRMKTFLKIDEWYSLWQDRLKLETCTKDPGRLGNFKVRYKKKIIEITPLLPILKLKRKKDKDQEFFKDFAKRSSICTVYK